MKRVVGQLAGMRKPQEFKEYAMTEAYRPAYQLEKAGQTLVYYQTGEGHILRRCIGACCITKEKFDRYQLLPCHCHGLIVECTCKLRDKQCKRCRKVYIKRDTGGWYEIRDPHQKTEVAQ